MRIERQGTHTPYPLLIEGIKILVSASAGMTPPDEKDRRDPKIPPGHERLADYRICTGMVGSFTTTVSRFPVAISLRYCSISWITVES